MDFSIDEYLFIRSNKDYPNFKGHENRHFRNERPGYLLEKPTSAGIDFNMITDFELEEFVHDMYELMDKYLDVELAGEMMLEAILKSPDFEADCSIFERLKTAIEDKLKLLGKSFE